MLKKKITTQNIFSTKSVLMLLLVYGLIWLLHLNAVALTAPIDDLEQLIWVRSLEWGYYKHPPLPTWILAPFVTVLGYHVFTVYLLGAITNCLALLVFWDLLRRIYQERFAWVGLLAASCITFYCFRMYYYNHNVVMFLLVVLTASIFYRALISSRVIWWLLLGVTGAAGMLTKYQYALVLAPMIYIYIRQRYWQQSEINRGLLISFLLALALWMPHLMWLIQTPDNPLTYAAHTSLGAHFSIGKSIQWSALWLVDLVFNRSVPGIIFVGICYFLFKKEPWVTDQENTFGNSYLVAWGLWPILMMFCMGVFAGVDVQLQWGTAFAIWVIPVVMLMAKLDRRTLEKTPWQTVGVAYLVVQLILSYVSFDKSAFGFHPSGHWNNMPSKQWASELAEARKEIGGPIRIISGGYTVAGAIAMQLPERPKVLIDGNLAISPWISQEEIDQGGIVELIDSQEVTDAHPLSNGWSWRVMKTH